ncbi:MAG: NUDIX domain-containing protein [Alphaproteobacteria bacterium]
MRMLLADRAVLSVRRKLAEESIGVHEEARTKDRFALVLLKNEGVFTPTYFMERRLSDDPVYPGRLGLYGGLIEPDETAVECAVREIKEETGLEVAQRDLVKLFEFTGENDKGVANEGEVFVYTFRRFKGTSASKIEKHQKVNRAKIIESGDFPGTPVTIRPRFGTLSNWLDWKKLTPQAAFALLADLDREKRANQPG